MSNAKKKSSLLVGSFVVLICLIGVSAYGLHTTSKTEFCMSCHEMEPYQKELKFSSHAKDKDGKVIGCAQCHIPAGIGPDFLTVKLYSGVKDLVVHLWSAPESLDRVHAQKVARRFIDDDNCLACHADLYKDAKGEKPVSEIGKLAHDAYLGKNGSTKRNCAGCHMNLAHLPEFDQRLEVNSAFTSRYLKEEELR